MKRIIFVSIFLLSLLLITFHRPLLTQVAAWAIHSYSSSHWGSPLRYKDMVLEGNRLIITAPSLEHHFSFRAERLSLEIGFDWKKILINLNIHMENPNWDFPQAIASSSEKWKRTFGFGKRWLKFHPHFHISRGFLTWSDNLEMKHAMRFDGEADSRDGGFVKACLDSQNDLSNLVELKTGGSDVGMEIHCLFQGANCRSLIALAHFFGYPLTEYHIASGTLSGELKAFLPKEGKPYFTGEVKLKQFAFNHPGQAFEGGIEEALLKIDRYQSEEQQLGGSSAIVGKVELLKPGHVLCRKEGQSWSLQHILGSAVLNGTEAAMIHLEAEGGMLQHPSQWVLEGEANFNAKRLLNFNLGLRSTATDRPEGKMQLALVQTDQSSKQAHIQLEKLSYTEVNYLQALLSPIFPYANDIEFQGGIFDALLEADIAADGLGEVRVKQIQAVQFKSNIKPWSVRCDFDLVQGNGKANLNREDFWATMQAGLHLENGSVNIEGFYPPLPLTDIQAHLLIHNGEIENSLATLQLAGLKGKTDVQWGKRQQLLTFKLDGTVQDLTPLLPSALKKGLGEYFSQDRLMILANVTNQNNQIELGGTLHIEDALSDHMDTIHFGCEFKREGSNSAPKYTPVGWFYANRLPVEKYVSPFIFPEAILHIEGDAEFKGSFDDQQLTLKYDAEHLILENENLRMEINQLHSSIPGQFVGTHQYDFRTHQHHGSLPIQHAVYYEKNSGLLFQDIQGTARFEPSSIRIDPIEGFCEDLYFAGELALDYSDPAPGVFNLQFHCPVFSGKLSQAQYIFSYFKPSSFLQQLPLQGEVSAKGEGLRLNFKFFPDKKCELTGNIKGTVTDGLLFWDGTDMSLKGIFMDVDCDLQKDILEFSDIQGTLLAGKPNRTEEYQFTGHHVRLTHLIEPNLDFDVAIKDREDEIARLAMHTRDQREGVKSWHLEPQVSHISCIYPQKWNCWVKDWSRFEKLEFSSQFDVGMFLQDLVRFRRSGLFFISHCMLDKLSVLMPIQGKGSIALQAEPDQSISFQLEGKDIKQGKFVAHDLVLKGSKRDKKWNLEQIQWNDWSAYAELQHDAERWKIPFLGLKIGQSVLLGLEGDFIPHEGVLNASLNFCEMDIEKLDRWDILKPFMAKWHPKGHVKASGEMELSCLLSHPMEGFKATLTAETNDLSFRSYPLEIIKPFQIEIDGLKGFTIEGAQVKTSLPQSSTSVILNNLKYQPFQDELQVLQLHFDIPTQEVAGLGESLQHYFSDLLDEPFMHLLSSVYCEGAFQGNLSIENCRPNGHCMQLTLEDGMYGYKKRRFALEKIEIQLFGGQLNFSAFSKLGRLPIQVVGWTSWPECSLVQTTLITPHPPQDLLIKWQRHLGDHYGIQSMKGTFCGCSFDFSEDSKESYLSQRSTLKGKAVLDFDRLRPLLSVENAMKIQQLKLGSPYSFQGHVWLDQELGESLLETLYFKGVFNSSEASIKGYKVQSIQGEAQYRPGRLDLQNLSFQDPAGSIKVPSLVVALDPQLKRWTLCMPQLNVKNLRLPLLRDSEGAMYTARSKFNSLLIKRIELRDFCGELNQQKTWQATGSLHFANSTKKNLSHPIFAMPGEIIMRLGLNPTVLNPVTGTIHFNLQGDKFFLTKMKDVFSEGRGSKFYLAHGPDPSWMDMQGNLSVRIRMKQYNLIFKIAELFTVTVEGNIRKPRYILQKLPKSSHKFHNPFAS